MTWSNIYDLVNFIFMGCFMVKSFEAMASNLCQRANEFTHCISSFPSHYLIRFPLPAKLALIYSITLIAFTTLWMNPTTFPLNVLVISLSWIVVSNWGGHLSKYDIFKEKLTKGQSAWCILAPSLVKMALDIMKPDYFIVVNPTTAIVFSSAMIVAFLYGNLINNKENPYPRKNDSIQSKIEIMILNAIKNIEQLQQMLNHLFQLIEKNPDLKKLFEKYQEDHAPYAAHVNFREMDVSETDDIYERCIKVRRRERSLKHTLREIKRYIDSYTDLRDCFYEKLALFNEEKNGERFEELTS